MRKTLTILHTNDLHSTFYGIGPAADYTPFSLNDDATVGGYARLATLIRQRRQAREAQGPVLVLDAGDFSMGTAFAAATRETGCELQLMARMGFDATTFGNHEFDYGPDGIARSIGVAVDAGRAPPIVAANADFRTEDPRLAGLQRLARRGAIRPHLVLERGGLRIGIFGVLGTEAAFYTLDKGAAAFSDPIQSARDVVRYLRESEKVDLVVCLSHGGLARDEGGAFTKGEDVDVAREVPGIDVVIGGHSHTCLDRALIVNDRVPVVQTGKYGENLGELVLTVEGGRAQFASWSLHPVDDAVEGDRAIADEIEGFKRAADAAVFAPRGYAIDQPLVVASQDLPNTFSDIAAGTPLANFVSDAIRQAARTDIGLTANGMLRASLLKGRSGVQTVYDVFAVSPLGFGVADPTAGGALVRAFFSGAELKNILEFFLVDNPLHPGEYFPRVSGMRFRYDSSRPAFDRVLRVEMGDLDRGYRAIDVTGQDQTLHGVGCNLMLGLIIVAIPKQTQGKLGLVPKGRDGRPLQSRGEALVVPRSATASLLPPQGTIDHTSVVDAPAGPGRREVREWQAIMDALVRLPRKNADGVSVLAVDERLAETRAIDVARGV